MANYINENEFRKEVISCIHNDKVSNKLANYFELLAKKLANAYKYTDPQDREDAVSNAVLALLEKYKKFDPDKETDGKKTNCFSFCTQVALNGLRSGWNTIAGHKKDTQSIDSIFDESI